MIGGECMHKSQIFFWCCVFFIIGIGLASLGHVYILYALIMIFCSLCAFRVKSIPRYCWLFFPIMIILGYVRFNMYQPLINEHHIAFYEDINVTIRGSIIEEPDMRADHTKYVVRVKEGEIDNKIHALRGFLLVKADRFPLYFYDDYIEVECMIRRPGVFNGFDYGGYLSRYNIYATCYNPSITLITPGKHSVMWYLLEVKGLIMIKINRLIHEPHVSFLAGILLGSRRGIDPVLLDAFNATGTTHIIAVSGYNITLVSGFIIGMLERMYISRRYAFWCAILGVAIFTIITGASSAVVRSAIMGIIVLCSQYMGRKNSVHNVLVVTAVLMNIVNPRILMFDAGFQLSFLATVGLIYFNPYIEKLMHRIPEVLSLRESLSTTFASLVLTTPLLIYQFKRYSLIAPFANVLILPAIPLSMLLGGLALIVNELSIYGGLLLRWLTWLVLEYIIIVVTYCAQIPFASVPIENYTGLLSGAYCIFLLGGILWVRKYNKKAYDKDTVDRTSI